MVPARPLPSFLVNRYLGWKAVQFAENRAWFRRLAEEGQHPRGMIVACCDSRIDIGGIFHADPGEFFMHRNIANLIPPYRPDGDLHGTSAAVEFAVRVLRVPHVLVVGHSQCGGVAACHDMCCGMAPELERETSFIGRWMGLLRPAFEALSLPEEDRAARLEALGRAGVVASLHNLAGFPFVARAIEAGELALHGCYLDIGSGELEVLDPENGRFVALSR